MPIFISHSREDKELLEFFDRAFARTTTKSICAEFEKFDIPPWKQIRDWIRQSSAVFLLLGPNVERTTHTQNWVSFEVGLACGMGEFKKVWIFEQLDQTVDFPVPYLNHYMLLNTRNDAHFDYLRAIVESYQPMLISPSQPLGIPITCAYDNCGINFHLHTNIEEFKCPSCRQPLVR